MASLLPTGHVSAALGVVYMLALELRKVYTNTPPDDEMFGPLISVGGDPNNFGRGAEAVQLEIKYIDLVNKQDDLQEHECLQLVFAPKDGRLLPKIRMNILIEPPYTGFFSSRRRRMWSHDTVSFFIDEVQIVNGFRRRLLSGDIQGFITDEHGSTVAIPQTYWASDRCADILKYDVSTLVKVGNLDVFGRVSFCRADIDRLYAADRHLNERPSDEDSGLARLIHRGLAFDVFWVDGERDRPSVLTRMGSDRFVGV